MKSVHGAGFIKMPEDVTARVATLPKMTKQELQALWRELFRRPAPTGLRRGFLIRILAYRVQELAYGGLSAETQKRLRELARKFASDPETAITVNNALSRERV